MGARGAGRARSGRGLWRGAALFAPAFGALFALMFGALALCARVGCVFGAGLPAACFDAEGFAGATGFAGAVLRFVCALFAAARFVDADRVERGAPDGLALAARFFAVVFADFVRAAGLDAALVFFALAFLALAFFAGGLIGDAPDSARACARMILE